MKYCVCLWKYFPLLGMQLQDTFKCLWKKKKKDIPQPPMHSPKSWILRLTSLSVLIFANERATALLLFHYHYLYPSKLIQTEARVMTKSHFIERCSSLSAVMAQGLNKLCFGCGYGNIRGRKWRRLLRIFTQLFHLHFSPTSWGRSLSVIFPSRAFPHHGGKD